MLAMFGMPGYWEIIAIVVVALLIFGPRIPKIARGIGGSITSFRQGVKEGDVREETDDAGSKEGKA